MGSSLHTALKSIQSLLDSINSHAGVIENNTENIDKYLIKIIEMMGEDPANGQNYSQVLQNILDALGKLGDIDTHMTNKFNAILEALANKADEGFDASQIIALLKDILEAITNHTVLVEVHSDGSCDITVDDPNEGSQTDLTGPLGARMKALAQVLSVGGTYEDPDAVKDIQSADKKDGKYMIDGKVVIINDGKAYDTLGRPIK